MKYILIVFFVLHTSFVYANDNRTRCLITDFTTINTSPEIGIKTTALFKSKLSEKYFYFLQKTNESKTILPESGCDSDCIIKLHSVYGDAIIITGSINRIENIIGERKISRYLVEDIKEEKYLFTVKLIDLKTNSTNILFEKELSATKDIEIEAIRIGIEINELYKIEIPIHHKPVQIAEKTPLLIFSGVSIMPAYLTTAGDYKNISRKGYGIASSLYTSTPQLGNLYLSFNISAILLQNTQDRIDSAYMFSSHFLAGYTFTIYENIKISPAAGPGYVFHLINGDRNSSGSYNSDFYYNPSLMIGVETSWSLNENFDIILRPSWGIFFEQNSSPHYMMVNLGIRKNF